MKRLLKLLILWLLAPLGCGVTSSQMLLPDVGPKPVTVWRYYPQMDSVLAAWERNQQCSGLKPLDGQGPFEVRWLKGNIRESDSTGSGIIAYYRSDTIIVDTSIAGKPNYTDVDQHELLHYLVHGRRFGTDTMSMHPWFPWVAPCRLMWDQHHRDGKLDEEP